MKNLLRFIYTFTALLYSCSGDNLNESDFLAGDSFTDSNIRVVFMDTLSVRTSTMKFDSIITSLSTRILVGKYVDSIFGEVEATNFFELVPSTYDIDAEAEYDSIALYLRYDDYYYNDTLSNNTIRIKRLSERLAPETGDYFYNTSNVAYFDEDLGILSYSPRPLGTDSLEIKLTDEFGEDLFDKFQENDITNLDEFKAYFKGISLRPGENDDGSVIGFSSTSTDSYVRLYFSVSEAEERVQSYIDFTLDLNSSSIPFFNRITGLEPIEYLKLLTDKEVDLYSSETENKTYVQSGTGIATRIEFPHVKSLYTIQGDGTILSAVLKIRPTSGTYDGNLILKDTLNVYIVDRNNDLTEQLLLADIEPVRGILNRDNEEFNDIYYEIPLGTYIEKLLLAESDTDEALILLPTNYDSTVDRFILNGENAPSNGTRLELNYAIYD
ncbi:MAG: DUF4270 family protein [Saonia sp.]